MQASEYLPTLPETERFPTHALFNKYYEILPKHGLVTHDETKFSRVLYKIGGGPEEETLLERFEDVLARMGIDVEFSLKDGTGKLDGISDRGEVTHEFKTRDLDNLGRDFNVNGETLGPANYEHQDYSVSSDGSYHRELIQKSRQDEEEEEAEYTGINQATQEHDLVSLHSSDFEDDEARNETDTKFEPGGTYQSLLTVGNRTLPRIREALALRHYERYLLQRIVGIWKDTSMEQREDNAGLAIIAAHRDKLVLLQSALHDWRDKLMAKQMTQAADDALARRHIVRTKFFHAWKNLAMANRLATQKAEEQRQHLYELKRSLFLGTKYFRHWQAIVIERRKKEEAAEAFFKAKMKMKFFGVRKSTLASESLLPNQISQMKSQSSVTMAEGTSKSSLATPGTILSTAVQQRSGEDAGYSTELSTIILRRACEPSRLQAQSNAAIEIWRARAQQEETASRIDKTKIIREAWTVWQDRIRINVVDDSIISRILLVCLYKVIMAARVSAFEKRVDQRIKHGVLSTWTSRVRNLVAKIEALVKIAEAHLGSKKIESVFTAFTSQMAQQEKLKYSAAQFRYMRLSQITFDLWEDKGQHNNELLKWSRQARFFFLATKSVKYWRKAVDDVKREKRKHAYTLIRRTLKISLARGTLQTWRDKTHSAIEMSSHAKDVCHNKLVVSAMEILDRWRGHAEELMDMEASASKMQQRKALTAWKDRMTAVEELEVEAQSIYIARRGKEAFRRWSLESLKVRAKSNYADDILDKNSKKTFRRVFATWKQKVDQPPALDLHFSVTARTSRYGQLVKSPFRAPEIVIEEASGVESFNAQDILPFDFETPSKPPRLPSTTPAAPLSSASESRLRAQFSEGSRTMRKSSRRGLAGGGEAD